eukprot:TRINITY_DN5119_c0_g1_i1.p1 TRINITY_DN5119_c0_g1~~TRINITY_DN5119_c0_g1_i1.p1  ORF type:complete len:623 (+),score=134.12 TRINITY_DN5119_c0_g1_i1:153-2021(+)
MQSEDRPSGNGGKRPPLPFAGIAGAKRVSSDEPALQPLTQSRRGESQDMFAQSTGVPDLRTPAAAGAAVLEGGPQPGSTTSTQGSKLTRLSIGRRTSLLGEHRTLSVGALVVLVYYGVSGGPFGVESAVRHGGPLLALLGFVVLPFVWAVPEALVTTELSTALPEAAGYVAWVEEAFGSNAGFMEGYMSWLSGVTDNSIYAALFLEYLVAAADGSLDELSSGVERWVVIVLVTVVLVYLNYRGLELVGNIAIGICLFGLAPFVCMVLMGIPQVEPSRLVEPPVGGWSHVNWGPLLNILFWNLNYWDSASSFAGEVNDPGRTFPKAMAMAVLLVVPTYMLPLAIGIGATRDSWSDWHDGHFSVVGLAVGGWWLQYWVALAAGVSNIGMFEAELSSDALQLAGMAERRMLPQIFARRSAHGTPTWALFASCLCLCFLGGLRFGQIIEMLNFLYCFAELLEFAAFIWLRIKRPIDAQPGTPEYLPRLYTVPLSTAGCVAMLTPASILILVIVFSANTETWVMAGSLIVLGIMGRAVDNMRRGRGRSVSIRVPGEHARALPTPQAGVVSGVAGMPIPDRVLLDETYGTLNSPRSAFTMATSQHSASIMHPKRGRSPVVMYAPDPED